MAFSRWKSARAVALMVTVSACATVVRAGAAAPPADLDFYLNLSKRVRTEGRFEVPVPGAVRQGFGYSLKMGDAIFPQPIISDFHLNDGSLFFRSFWEKIALQDDSYLEISGERIPLTCIFVSGQDNRFSGNSSVLFPEFVLKIYLVANDYTCTGPINPGWPSNGAPRETWDTYLYYEVKDPTIMLPVEVKLRYRRNEMPAVLIDSGRGGN